MAVLQACFRKLMLWEENSDEVKGPASSGDPGIRSRSQEWLGN